MGSDNAIGTWVVGTAKWTAEHLAERDFEASDLAVSAVFVVALIGGGILAVRNERGWDLPGGHVERGESLLEALRRETAEEAAATFERAVPFALISSSDSADVMVFYLVEGLTLAPFVASSDAFERRVMPTEELVTLYYGERRMLSALLDAAQKSTYSK